ncbi:MAG: EAL domain-containing protein [Candidatus Thiodiazotropha taylori]|nr:EAL domain-containing protein [Candidatus Thiodiazotropha taylori]MCG8090621.1 EAL domain-containing protein [Candidatus Thiodiazotropha taylori]MCW4276000.1 EAL domain-containing protein [Candidatus Thiodiazotropha taylori]MCW4324400.1 EAL domain-containing protein [Candidatus Thiodiazotropha taylori]
MGNDDINKPGHPNHEYMRERAEQIAQRRQRITFEKKLADRDRLLQDLHVHQIELELQNEELRQSQAKLEFTHQQYLDLYNEAPVGYASLDDSGLIIRSNQMLASMLGMEKYSLTGKALAEFMLPIDQNIFRSRFNAFVKQPQDKHIDVRFKVGDKGSDTSSFIGRIQGRRLDSDDRSGSPHWSETILIVISDVTEIKKSEEKIHYQAFHDLLTGIPNRASLYERLENALALAKRQHSFGALLFMDLDRFKNINDSLGHHTGDKLLIDFTSRIQKHTRKEDMLFRMGGDEFVILLAEQHHDKNIMAVIAQRFAEHITSALSEPIILGGHSFQITLSIGISIFPFQSKDNLNDVVRQADTAMYQAKKEGGALARFFQANMQEMARQRMILEAELRVALVEQQFSLYYQPQMRSDGSIYALEALLRWQHPYRGIVTPDQFIHVAEDTSMIVEIGNWVLETAVKQIITWQQQKLFDPSIRYAINVSAKQLENSSFYSQVKQIIERYKLDPNCLVFEITESLLLPDNKVANDTLKQLSELDITFSVDDFGTGYSSLATIDNAPIGQLKIDRSFISQLQWSQEHDSPKPGNQYSLVNAILSMGKALELEVIAEGVETEEQLKVLTHLGCEYVQGYYFSKPIPVEQIPEIVPSTELS